VSRDELLFTLETDKVSQEVMAADSGILHTKVAEGDEVKIGQVVAEIEPVAAGAPAAPAPAPVEEKAPAPVAEAPKAPAPVSTPPPAPAPKAAPAPAQETQALSTDSRATRKKLSPLRRKIATQLVMAQQTAAILTTFNECDMSAVMSLRKELQEDFSKKHGVKLGFMSFFIKAVVDALQAIPSINSRIDGDELITNNAYDIGVAVGTERGLIVPVLKDCEKLSFAEIEASLAGFATKAREGRISLEDLSGGVFTISNGGVYGSLLSTPILNPPQSGILGMHKIQERAVVINGQIVARPMMYLALSYDHRVVDGKEAVTFLVRVKDCLENPARLLLGA
jgi:2-oxoglutarate dehydrogenase E2 component (dihydrolipoamide succinyltransferase)